MCDLLGGKNCLLTPRLILSRDKANDYIKFPVTYQNQSVTITSLKRGLFCPLCMYIINNNDVMYVKYV